MGRIEYRSSDLLPDGLDAMLASGPRGTIVVVNTRLGIGRDSPSVLLLLAELAKLTGETD